MEKIFYRVQKGDLITSVCLKHDIPISRFIKDNNLKEELYEGQIVIINKMQGKTYTVAPHENLKTVAKKLGVLESEIIEKNQTDYLFYGLKIWY
ncbi:MAG: LysM peptidoglycan-binding domain-containing protein [Clostridia bacterium]|nr:LysM peptidoglycan-binding domain-containing protein [Clostridia bacterium]